MTSFWVAGSPASGSESLAVISPADGSVAGVTSYATVSQVEQAVAAAQSVPSLSAAERASALDHVSATLTARREEIAALITAENGKPGVWAQAEVSRAISTFRWAAEEARRFSGELMRLDTDAA